MPFVRSRNDLNTGDTEPSDQSKQIRSLEKIMNYMAINGAMLMLSFFTLASMSMSLYGLVSFQFWECRVFFWAISRITITYSQVRTILTTTVLFKDCTLTLRSPSSHKLKVKMIAKNKVNTTKTCEYRCSCFRERMPVTPQDEPPERPSTSIHSNQFWAMFFIYRPDSNAGDP